MQIMFVAIGLLLILDENQIAKVAGTYLLVIGIPLTVLGVFNLITSFFSNLGVFDIVGAIKNALLLTALWVIGKILYKTFK